MLSWLRRRAARQETEAADDPGSLDPDVLDCLKGVLDPEVGVSVVALGLVYRALRTPDRVEVDLTLTTRTCPLGGLLVEDAREHLRRRFGDCPDVVVTLVWSPAWTPDRITGEGLEALGHQPPSLRERLRD
ncbi:metal-sulfur cluster assembly factor [Methylobacterium sp. WSM2598]|uniref:metal-sulfur cluster assembly factor n=1 Tax=Methylobacterium sp. WSM2598 TaxID=398261 RepID=UPI00036985F2|nr:metal-sulfur cluster assembly factor [Methylobacterium sp. WSM2598]